MRAEVNSAIGYVTDNNALDLNIQTTSTHMELIMDVKREEDYHASFIIGRRTFPSAVFDGISLFK